MMLAGGNLNFGNVDWMDGGTSGRRGTASKVT